MRWRRNALRTLVRTALLIGVVAAIGPTAGAQAAAEGGPLTQRCVQTSELLRTTCHGVETLASDANAHCRRAGVPDSNCAVPFGRQAHTAQVEAFRRSWVHKALALQYELAGDVGLRNAPWVGTHNSFNSIAEMGPTLSDTDSNQVLSLTDQLNLGVRGLEVDTHWFPSLSAGGGNAPVVCHAGAVSDHDGCTVERPLGPVLGEIGSWLRQPQHSDQVLLLYIEDHLDNTTGYDTGAATIDKKLGDLVYRPPAGAGCTDLPLDLTRDQILASGAQMIIVGNSSCGQGDAWPGLVFNWHQHVENGPDGYRDFPDCGPDYDRPTYDSTLVRFYEDSTWLTDAASFGQDPPEGLTPQVTAAMARCGVDLTGFDQLLPDDGRLAAAVWSWAPGEPTGGSCATQVVNDSFPAGRWDAVPCNERHRPACRTSDGSWLVAPDEVRQRRGTVACQDAGAGAELAVPRTGYEAQLLRVAMQDAGAAPGQVWLGYRHQPGGWTAADDRG
jgi:hypothetical protein